MRCGFTSGGKVSGPVWFMVSCVQNIYRQESATSSPYLKDTKAASLKAKDPLYYSLCFDCMFVLWK